MGLNIFNIFLLGLTFTLYVISAGYITDSSRRIGNLPEKETNKDLENAYKFSVIASIISWITVALLLLSLGVFIYLSVIFSEEEYATGTGFSNYFVNGALFLSLLGIITTGILSILTANNIKKSEVSDNNNSYRQAIIASVISLVTFFGILIIYFIKLFYKPKSKADKLNKEEDKLEDAIDEADSKREKQIPKEWEETAADKWGETPSSDNAFRNKLKRLIYE